jgi:hypothetical protein
MDEYESTSCSLYVLDIYDNFDMIITVFTHLFSICLVTLSHVRQSVGVEVVE